MPVSLTTFPSSLSSPSFQPSLPLSLPSLCNPLPTYIPSLLAQSSLPLTLRHCLLHLSSLSSIHLFLRSSNSTSLLFLPSSASQSAILTAIPSPLSFLSFSLLLFPPSLPHSLLCPTASPLTFTSLSFPSLSFIPPSLLPFCPLLLTFPPPSPAS